MKDTILVVDDSPDVLRMLVQNFRNALGWRVFGADGVESATALMKRELPRIALVISDDHMGGYGKNGADLFLQRSLDLELNRIPFILASGGNSAEFMAVAREFGMHPVRKPYSLDSLHELVRGLVGDSPRLMTRSGEL